MRRYRWLLVAGLIGLASGCGGGSKSSTSTTQRTNTNPLSKLQYRAFVANNFQKVLHIIDESKDQLYTFTSSNFVTPIPGNIPITEASVGLSASPVALVSAGPGVTVVVTQDATGSGLSFVNNALESQTGAVVLPGTIASAVATSDGKTVYAAVPSSNTVFVVDIATAMLTAQVTVPNVQRLVLSSDGSKLLAFSGSRNFFTVIKTADNSTQQVTNFDSAVYGVFSSDNSKAYVLNCGPECGGSAPPAVTVVDLSTTPPTPGASLTVAGATIATQDSSGNLYVAGSPSAGPLKGVLSVVSLSGLTLTKTAPISDGFHNLMATTGAGKIYIGARNCTDQPSVPNSGCLSAYNISANTAVVDQARGDVTGIQPVTAKNRNVVYVAVGGQFLIYDGSTDQPQTTQVPLTGQITDVRSAQ